MAKTAHGAALDRKKLMADPIMVTTIVLLIAFLTLFILYPLAILLVDSVVSDGRITLDTFRRIMNMPNFTRSITNTLKVGFMGKGIKPVGVIVAMAKGFYEEEGILIDKQVVSSMNDETSTTAHVGVEC